MLGEPLAFGAIDVDGGHDVGPSCVFLIVNGRDCFAARHGSDDSSIRCSELVQHLVADGEQLGHVPQELGAAVRPRCGRKGLPMIDEVVAHSPMQLRSRLLMAVKTALDTGRAA